MRISVLLVDGIVLREETGVVLREVGLRWEEVCKSLLREEDKEHDAA